MEDDILVHREMARRGWWTSGPPAGERGRDASTAWDCPADNPTALSRTRARGEAGGAVSKNRGLRGELEALLHPPSKGGLIGSAEGAGRPRDCHRTARQDVTVSQQHLGKRVSPHLSD